MGEVSKTQTTLGLPWMLQERIGSLKHFSRRPAGRARPRMPRRRPRCTLGAGGPPRVPPPPAGAAPSQAERGAAPLALGLDRRRRLG
jgi:hypothetical protein